jgi:L-amino acid N-acyltransferase YncA
MITDTGNIVTRLAKPSDAGELSTLLNEIILIGGTTSHKTPFTGAAFVGKFLQGESHLCCYVAVDAQGHLAGFQTLDRHPEIPEDWADVATFARVEPKLKGVGTALFAKTKLHAKQLGITAINATIREYNKGGLIYYDKIGFETYTANGESGNRTGTDQVSKRFYIM